MGFFRDPNRPQVFECIACGALIEERPRLEGIGVEYVVKQEADE